MKNVGKSTYGERVGFSARLDSGELHVIFTKNGNSVCLFGADLTVLMNDAHEAV